VEGVVQIRICSLYILYKEQKQRAITLSNLKTVTICVTPIDDKASVKVSSKSLEKCRRSCAKKKLFTPASLLADIPQSNKQTFPLENLVKT
jgi:hypothetical protein